MHINFKNTILHCISVSFIVFTSLTLIILFVFIYLYLFLAIWLPCFNKLELSSMFGDCVLLYRSLCIVKIRFVFVRSLLVVWRRQLMSQSCRSISLSLDMLTTSISLRTVLRSAFGALLTSHLMTMIQLIRPFVSGCVQSFNILYTYSTGCGKKK